jgi:hypothetical protein
MTYCRGKFKSNGDKLSKIIVCVNFVKHDKEHGVRLSLNSSTKHNNFNTKMGVMK